MRINEAAEQAGVTAKNIRFYEQEKLLTPAREKGNSYRTYSDADVRTLKIIRLLRMLDFPIAEIRSMLAGEQSLQSGLGRQQTLLEDRSRSLNAARDLCDHLAAGAASLAELDPDECLAAAMQQQKKGVCFVDIKKQDTKRKKYLGALLGAGSFLVIMLFVLAILIWAFATDPQNAPPLPIVAFLFAVILVPIAGVLAALYARFKEIKGGEENDYRNY